MSKTLSQQLEDASRSLRTLRKEREEYVDKRWQVPKRHLEAMQKYWHGDKRLNALLQDTLNQRRIYLKRVMACYDEAETNLKKRRRNLQQKLDDQQAAVRKAEDAAQEVKRRRKLTQSSQTGEHDSAARS
jgi:hypothetical protein